jgi:GNAT superfamily N-acetyltransferase
VVGPAKRPPVCKSLPLTIRAAKDDELEEIAALYQTIAAKAFTWRHPGFFKAADFLKWAKSEEIYVALVGGHIAGLLSFYRPENFIHSLFVEEDAQGFGIGQGLIAHVRALADGPLSLKVDVNNERAIDFYERHGWRRARGNDSTGVDRGVRWLRYTLG